MNIVSPEERPEAARDYERIAAAIRYLDAHATEQPSLDDVAKAVSVSPHHLQRVFTRWAGVSPKRFLSFLTLDHARRLLRQSESVLDTALEAGLSGPGRLHDLFVTFDAVTPGEFKAWGAGLEIRYGIHESPFGDSLILLTDRGVCGLTFVDGDPGSALATAKSKWPGADFRNAPDETGPAVARIFGGGQEGPLLEPLHLWARGTNFQVKVWEALLAIPEGRVTTYGRICRQLDMPQAARAVGRAVGANPLGYLIPCHRVIRGSGGLGGYAWGLERKTALLAWEQARQETAGTEA